jgi:hypothetical protein
MPRDSEPRLCIQPARDHSTFEKSRPNLRRRGERRTDSDLRGVGALAREKTRLRASPELILLLRLRAQALDVPPDSRVLSPGAEAAAATLPRMKLRTPLCDLLGIEVPICLAGMGGVAYAEVCAAVSEAGGFGTLGMAAATTEGIREEMRKVRDLTDKPFGVDLLACAAREHARFDRRDHRRRREGVHCGARRARSRHPALPRRGLLVMSMCGKVSHAIAAEDAGCDVVVAQGTRPAGTRARSAASR